MNRRSAMKLLGGLLVGGSLGCMAFAKNPLVPTAEMAKLINGNNAFALDLYAKVREKDGNLFFSPSSISTALGMTYAGARENTATQMAKAMHFDLPQDELHPTFHWLIGHLNGEGTDPAKRGYQLSVANALWGQKGYPWVKEFLETTRKNYGAGLQEVDFVKATEAARKTINEWVEKQTKDKIKELLKEGILTVDTRLVLTNAIYFKGDWAVQFDKKATFDQDFHVSKDRAVKAPMMHRSGEYRMYEDRELQVLDLPYKGKDLSMFVVLPRKIDGLDAVEKTLSADKLGRWSKEMRNHSTVVVTLPKFKMTSEFLLNDELKKLGMTDAFSRSADFSGMNGKKNDLYISAVVHKAFVDVNEEGTEAAAATAVVVEARSARVDPIFRADHPFLFIIRDNRTDTILFMGRVANPGQ